MALSEDMVPWLIYIITNIIQSNYIQLQVYHTIYSIPINIADT